MDSKKILRRYTNIPSMLRILKSSKITLLPAKNWDDENDRRLMSAFATATRNRTCLALCFAEGSETYHHWKNFSSGQDGVCIVFNKEKLIQCAAGELTAHRKIRYLSIKNLKNMSGIDANDLPFIKRWAYRQEREYRFLFADDSHHDAIEKKDISIDINSIERILINPWMPEDLFETLKEIISDTTKPLTLKVRQSTIRNNIEWKKLADKYTKDYTGFDY